MNNSCKSPQNLIRISILFSVWLFLFNLIGDIPSNVVLAQNQNFPPNGVPAQSQAACIQSCFAAGGNVGKCEDDCGVTWENSSVFDPFEGPTEETFDFLNPLNLGTRAALLSTPGGILTQVLIFAFPLGGLILFIMLVWGGFEILLGGANKKYVDSGKQRITAAFVGFFLLFSSYWITQIVEVIFGVAIL